MQRLTQCGRKMPLSQQITHRFVDNCIERQPAFEREKPKCMPRVGIKLNAASDCSCRWYFQGHAGVDTSIVADR